MKLVVVDDYDGLSREAASLVEAKIKSKPDSVICFPTGNTPLGLYGKLSLPDKLSLWEHATVVCLDEYLGVRKEDPNSLVGWLKRELLDRLRIPEGRMIQIDPVHPEPYVACSEYDEKIRALGGIDLTILGLGPNGHVGFNEPGTTPDLPSRVIRLTDASKRSNASYWEKQGASVPDYGLTMGMTTLLEQSKHALLLVSGPHKAGIFSRFLKEPPTPDLPAAYLKTLANLTVIADAAAAQDHMPGTYEL